MLVNQIMCRDVETCSPHDTLETVTRICWDHDVGVVPVVQDGRVVGVVTDRDCAMAAYTRGCALRDMLVSTAMSAPVRACRPEASVVDAMHLMADAQVRRVVVTDAEGRLVGILSMNDVVREAARGNARMAAEVLKAQARICAPRAADVAMPQATDLVASRRAPAATRS